jgi:hypothetical protein
LVDGGWSGTAGVVAMQPPENPASKMIVATSYNEGLDF